MRKAQLKFINLISIGLLFFSLTSFILSKEKPVIHYEIDVKAKHIIFEDISGNYMIDNDHIDVIKSGDLKGVKTKVDISDLPKGHYTLEINHLGYVYLDDIMIE